MNGLHHAISSPASMSGVLALTLWLLLSAMPVTAQERDVRLDVQSEPVSFLMGGGGLTGAVQSGTWRFSLEAFTLSIPTSFHGNEGFDNSLVGLELHVERFLGDTREGLFLGPEVGVSHLEVVHEESEVEQDRVQYSAGLRLGYRRYVGLGNLYLSPVVGLVHSLNGRDFEFDQATFEVGSLTPFVTLGIGWTFGSGR